VKDFYFDDKTWAVRYLVADTGLMAVGTSGAAHATMRSETTLLAGSDADADVLHVSLTRKQIEDSPVDRIRHPAGLTPIRGGNTTGYYGWPGVLAGRAACLGAAGLSRPLCRW